MCWRVRAGWDGRLYKFVLTVNIRSNLTDLLILKYMYPLTISTFENLVHKIQLPKIETIVPEAGRLQRVISWLLSSSWRPHMWLKATSRRKVWTCGSRSKVHCGREVRGLGDMGRQVILCPVRKQRDLKYSSDFLSSHLYPFWASSL